MAENTFEKTCEILTEKIVNLESTLRWRVAQVEELKEENAKLKEENAKLQKQKQAVTEFVDRTRVETRVKGG